MGGEGIEAKHGDHIPEKVNSEKVERDVFVQNEGPPGRRVAGGGGRHSSVTGTLNRLPKIISGYLRGACQL